MGSIFYVKRESKDKDGKLRGAWRYEDKQKGIRDTFNERFANQIKRLREAGVSSSMKEIVDRLIEIHETGDLHTAPLFKDYIKEFLEYQEKIKENRSIMRTRSCLKQFTKLYGDKRLNEISIQDIDDYKSKRKSDGLVTNSIKRELAVVKSLFSHAISREIITSRNPVIKIESKDDSRKRILDYEEEQRLLTFSTEPVKSMILIALYTGMRANEIRSLEWDWINFNENEINLPARVVKNKKDRTVLINPDIRTLLLKQKMKSNQSKYVFPSPVKKDCHIVDYKRGFKKACKQAGISNLRFHDLRRTCGSRLGKAGVPIQVIQLILGHSDIRVTEKYVVSDKATVREAIGLLRITYFDSFQSSNKDNIS